jgi:dTDP-4-dehydrorhamnose reductase
MIWLIGNKGMLGTELSLLLKKNGLDFIGTDIEVDITNIAILRDFTKQNSFIKWIINCAAYTAVDKAEDDKETCHLINIEGSRNIAAAAKEIGAVIVHISTDYVFNGRGIKPYTEEDETDPIGIYGLSKRFGEIKILEENNKSFIIRTAWLYGKYGNNFVHTILRLIKEKDNISIVNDQIGSPTWARDLAQMLIEFYKQSSEGRTIPYGIYNYTNEGEITWFDFAKEIYKQAKNIGILKKDCEINSCTSAEFPAKVTRPAYSVLDKTKIKNTLGISIPDWHESLKLFLDNIM